VVACPITRVTAKRIYFRGGASGLLEYSLREFYIDRAAIERGGDVVGKLLSNGGVYHRGVRQILHLEPPVRREFAPVDEKTIAALRKEAADLHPDRGGDPDQFRAAHARYTAAKAATR
jgi:hypothetical protein